MSKLPLLPLHAAAAASDDNDDNDVCDQSTALYDVDLVDTATVAVQFARLALMIGYVCRRTYGSHKTVAPCAHYRQYNPLRRAQMARRRSKPEKLLITLTRSSATAEKQGVSCPHGGG